MIRPRLEGFAHEAALPIAKSASLPPRSSPVESISPVSFSALVQGILDPDVTVRRIACAQLVPTGEDRALAPLLSALCDADPIVQAHAVTGLARLNDPLLAPLMLPSLQSPDPEVRRATVEALSQLGEQTVKESASALLPMLTDPVAEIRELVAGRLSEVDDPTVRAHLSCAGLMGAEMERVSVLRALVDSPRVGEYEVLFRQVSHDQSPLIRELGQAGLQRCGEPDGQPGSPSGSRLEAQWHILSGW